MQDTISAFFSLNSLEDEPIIITDKSKEEEAERYEDTHATFHDEPEDTSIPNPPSPKSFQLQELMAQVLLLQSQKLKKEDLKDIPKETRDIQFHYLQSYLLEKLKTLDALPSLLTKVTDTLNKFATSVENASSKATNKSVPLVGQAGASRVEGEKNTKDADKANLKKQPTTTNLPTTSSFQSPLFPKSKGKEVMYSKDAKDEETKSDFENDHANPTNYMVESSKQKKLKKFIFVTEGGEQILFNAEKIEEQKRIE
ncbi:hypothetical protein Tco_1459411 [Tanacetum coccineum]